MTTFRRFLFTVLVAVCTAIFGTTVVLAQDESDFELPQPDLIVTVGSGTALSVCQIPTDIISAQEAFDIGIAALLHHFPQYRDAFFNDITWANMQFNDPAFRVPQFWQPGGREGQACHTITGRPAPIAMWSGSVSMESVPGAFVFSVVPSTGELIGVEFFVVKPPPGANTNYFRFCHERYSEIKALAKQTAVDGEWITGELTRIDTNFRLWNFVYCLDDRIYIPFIKVEVILRTDADEKVTLVFVAYNKQLQRVLNSAVSVNVWFTTGVW